MTKLSTDWLDDAKTQFVFKAILDAGYQAFAVGGCVRNTLLGVPANDIDIATSATPADLMALAAAADIKAIPTGFDHGTVTFVVANTPFEITTFRKDIETDGRHAVVAFTDNLNDDARRRDFTMNALYADASGTVHDPLGGMDDLIARRVRFIEDADARIKEDYLRSLRFFRFHAQYGDPSEGLDPDGLSAIAANLEGLSGLAGERIGAEMMKLLAATDPAPALGGMAATGALATVLPGSNPQWIAPLVHLETETGQSPRALRRLAALGGEDPGERFRLSRADARTRKQIADFAFAGTGISEVSWRHGPEIAWDVALIRQAFAEQPVPPETKHTIQRAAAANFPLKAQDLMDQVTGPALGAALKRAEKAWLESDFELSRAVLKEVALKEG